MGDLSFYRTSFGVDETSIKHMKQAPGLTNALGTSISPTSSVLSAGQLTTKKKLRPDARARTASSHASCASPTYIATHNLVLWSLTSPLAS